jgi:hypothetical protein
MINPLEYVKDSYRNIKYGLRNFWFWKEVIWNDRWFDFVYMLQIMEKKFEQMEKGWDNAHYLDSEVEQAEFKRVRELLTLLINDNFLQVAQEDMDKKYGKLELNLDDSDDTPLFLRGGTFETPEQKQDWKISMEVAAHEKRKTEMELFRLLKNYKKWWD